MEMLQEKEQTLRLIVNRVFNLELSRPTRLRSYVYARMVYCDVLKELGFGPTKIGRLLNVNHATVYHYWKSLQNVMQYDSDLKDKYHRAREEFYEGYDPTHGKNQIYDLKKRIFLLETQKKELSLLNKSLEFEIQALTKEGEKFANLTKIVKERTKPNTGKDIEIKLKRFYNGVYV